MFIEELKLFQALQGKIGKPEAEAFVQLIDQKVTSKFDQKKEELATRQDVLDLRLATKQDMSDLRAATQNEFASVRIEMTGLRSEFRDEFAKLRLEMAALREELLRTIYVANIGQLFAIVASVISIILVVLKNK